MGDSDKLQAGQWAIAVGEPFELKQSVSVGVVSGFNRDETDRWRRPGKRRQFRGMLQTSAPINPGNSGGPLVDVEGRLIGVNQSTANPQAGAQGIGFAIPVEHHEAASGRSSKRIPVKTLDANSTGTGIRYIGVALQALDDNVRAQINYQGKNGVVVSGVYQGTPADQAGLQAGDVITSIDGKPVNSPDDLTKVIRALKPGRRCAMQVFSAGLKKLVSVKIGEAPPGFGQQQQEQNGTP